MHNDIGIVIVPDIKRKIIVIQNWQNQILFWGVNSDLMIILHYFLSLLSNKLYTIDNIHNIDINTINVKKLNYNGFHQTCSYHKPIRKNNQNPILSIK
jgi:hypothetical protein